MTSVYIEDGRVEVRGAAIPKRRPGYALIRMIYAGICNTDLELQRGYYGFRGRPGHEFVGEVVEADTAAWVGKTVVGEINLACGNCEWCARKLGRHCPRRTVLGIVKHPGAMAEYLTLPEENLRAVPRGMSAREAVFTEPLAAACEILDQVKMARGSEAAVLGDGKLGLLAAQALAASGIRVHLFGRHKDKMKIASEAGVETRVAERMPEARFDVVVEATGAAEGLAQAVKMARARGTVVMKSTRHGAAELDAARVIVEEITLVGSRCGRFEPALRLLRSGKVKVDKMISGEYALRDAARAFERASVRGTMKVLLANG